MIRHQPQRPASNSLFAMTVPKVGRTGGKSQARLRQYATKGLVGRKLHGLAFNAEQAGRYAEAVCLAQPNVNSDDKWLAGAATFDSSRAWDGLGCHEQAVKAIEASLVARWEVSGSSLGLRVTHSIKLLDLYGDEVFAAAAADLDARGLADVGTLAIACEHHRKGRHRPVPFELVLPAHLDDADVIPHDLGAYDE